MSTSASNTAESSLGDGAALYTIGADVACSDGPAGQLRRVVMDPVARALTHLAVEPKHHRGTGRLVPVDLVDPTALPDLRLRCTTAEFDALDSCDETQFLSGANGQWGYEQEQMFTMPYYAMGMPMAMSGGIGPTGIPALVGTARPDRELTVDRIPAGEVEVHRGDRVHATDGPIGQVRGLVVAPDHQVTHVLLAEGHLWGRKTVAIPIGTVTGMGTGIRLSLTKDQVGDLPAADVDLEQ